MKIYTLTGDDGTTSLSGGRRVPKHSLRVEAYGTVDELIAWIGLLRDLSDEYRAGLFLYIQDQLMLSAAVLATDVTGKKAILPAPDCLTVLEKEIDKMEKKLPVLNSFILPGGNVTVSYCHIARCVCRRAERTVLRLKEAEDCPEIVHKFLNRLSDFLFVIARDFGYDSDIQELKWPLR